MPKVLDGAAISAQIKQEVAAEVQSLATRGIRPGLAAVLVGHVPASEIYVRSKVQTCAELGLYSDLITPPDTITTAEMLDLIASLNARDDIDGILVQLPLPKQVDAKILLDAVSPAKDVDGFHPVNAGRLQAGRPGARAMHSRRGDRNSQAQRDSDFWPTRGDRRPKRHCGQARRHASAARKCYGDNLPLEDAGPRRRDPTKPISWLLQSDGPASSLPEMVKPGATLIDVGINRIDKREEFDRFFKGNGKREAAFAKRGSVLVGDIHPAAFELSCAYTPVPGGVGLLTIAMLMANTVRAAKMRRGL